MPLTAQSLLAELDLTLSQATESWRDSVLRRIADLFMGDAEVYSKEQVVLFDAVMGRLVKNADRALLAELSAKLAAVDNAPPGVLGQFARNGDLTVSMPALSAKALSDKDLVEAADKDRINPAILEKIAARGELSEAVTDVLLKRGTPALQRALVDNPKAKLSDAGFARLLVSIKGDKELAAAISTREDVPKELRLWLAATMSS
jgi:uncharacterized protein (DUF2336 family)